jgi:hypothetical protein
MGNIVPSLHPKERKQNLNDMGRVIYERLVKDYE